MTTDAQEFNQVLRSLFAAINMHAELTTCGVPGQACDALVEAAHKAGREPEDQMAFNSVLCADALLRALVPADEAPPPAEPAMTFDDRQKLDNFPKFEALLQEISKSGGVFAEAAKEAIAAYNVDAMPF